MISTQSPVLTRDVVAAERLDSNSVAEMMLATRLPPLAFSRDAKVAVPPGWPGS